MPHAVSSNIDHPIRNTDRQCRLVEPEPTSAGSVRPPEPALFNTRCHKASLSAQLNSALCSMVLPSRPLASVPDLILPSFLRPSPHTKSSSIPPIFFFVASIHIPSALSQRGLTRSRQHLVNVAVLVQPPRGLSSAALNDRQLFQSIGAYQAPQSAHHPPLAKSPSKVRFQPYRKSCSWMNVDRFLTTFICRFQVSTGTQGPPASILPSL